MVHAATHASSPINHRSSLNHRFSSPRPPKQKRTMALTLGVVAALLVLSAASATNGTASELIAYQSVISGHSEIMVMEPDGQNQRQLTDNDAHDFNPGWAADAKRIAFVSTRDGNAEIYIMNVDGSDPRRLTDSPGQDTYPSMSPDGESIVFESYRDGHAEIYRMTADGTKVQRLTHFDGPVTDDGDVPPGNGNPSWSPL